MQTTKSTVIKISDIVEQENQVRRKITEEDIQDLKQSIQRIGLINPVTVSPIQGGYLLIAGHRRYAAMKSLGEYSIDAVIVKGSEPELNAIQLHENYGRMNISPIEEGEYFTRLRAEGYTIPEISVMAGLSETYIKGRIALTFMDISIQNLLHQKIISLESAKYLARIEDKEKVRDMCDIIEEGGMSTHMIRNWVQQYEKDRDIPTGDITKIEYANYSQEERPRKLFKCCTCNEKYEFREVTSNWICHGCMRQIRMAHTENTRVKTQ